MITHLLLPFLSFKVVVFDLLTLDHNSAAHDVVGVVHGAIFLLDFSFKVCDFLLQLFQLEGKNTVFDLVLIWSSVKEGQEVDDSSVVDERVNVYEEMEAA